MAPLVSLVLLEAFMALFIAAFFIGAMFSELRREMNAEQNFDTGILCSLEAARS